LRAANTTTKVQKLLLLKRFRASDIFPCLGVTVRSSRLDSPVYPKQNKTKRDRLGSLLPLRCTEQRCDSHDRTTNRSNSPTTPPNASAKVAKDTIRANHILLLARPLAHIDLESLPAHAVGLADLASTALEIGAQSNVAARLLLGFLVVLAESGDVEAGDLGEFFVKGSCEGGVAEGEVVVDLGDEGIGVVIVHGFVEVALGDEDGVDCAQVPVAGAASAILDWRGLDDRLFRVDDARGRR
jgi:hypothetical protein